MAGTVRKRVRTSGKGGAVRTTWLADYVDQNGKRHNRTFATRKAADAFLLMAKGEVRDGLHTPDADSITVAEAAELWLKYCQVEKREAGTLRLYAQYARLHINPLIGSRKLSRLTAPVVQNFRDAVLQRNSRRQAKGVLCALKGILKDSMRRGYLAQNVAAAVSIDDSTRELRPLEFGHDIASKEDIRAILEHASGVHRPRLVALIFTGMRASELRALFWSHIDFEKRQLQVRQRADHPWNRIGATKSRNGYRDIPLAPFALNVLKEWQQACPDSELGLAFPGSRGRVMSHGTLQRSFDDAQIAAGIVAVDAKGRLRPKYHLHALRHFFATWAIEQGFTPKRLQALLGHGSIRMTFDTYGHLFPNPEDDHARFAAGELALVGTAASLLRPRDMARG
jgi:integrase